MRHILALALLIAAFCTSAQAQSVGNANNFVVGAVASGSYTGPGDIVSSTWIAFFSFRAFTAAGAGTTNVATLACGTCSPTTKNFTSNANGSADITDMETYCGGSGNPNSCTVQMLDQTGNGHNSPTGMTLTFSCTGTGPPGACWELGSGGLGTKWTNIPTGTSQPITIIEASAFTTDPGPSEFICIANWNGGASCGSSLVGVSYSNGQTFMSATTEVCARTLGSVAWHAGVALLNSTSSLCNFSNGAATSGINAGSTGAGGNSFFVGGQNGVTCPSSNCGFMSELGIISTTAITTTQAASLKSNIVSNNGGF